MCIARLVFCGLTMALLPASQESAAKFRASNVHCKTLLAVWCVVKHVLRLDYLSRTLALLSQLTEFSAIGSWTSFGSQRSEKLKPSPPLIFLPPRQPWIGRHSCINAWRAAPQSPCGPLSPPVAALPHHKAVPQPMPNSPSPTPPAHPRPRHDHPSRRRRARRRHFPTVHAAHYADCAKD